METIKTLLILAGLGLAYNGYAEMNKDVTPTPPPVVNPDNSTPIPTPAPLGSIQIISDQDSIPPAPANSELLSTSLPIKQALMGNPADALKLARTFRGWSQLITQTQEIKTTSEFQNAYIKSMIVLLARHQMAGKYALNQPMDATFLAAFRAVGLVDGNTVKSAEWSPTAAQAAAQAFDAASYQCYQAFAESVKK